MTRNDSIGGWVPIRGGGFSNVSVRKRDFSEDERKPEYVICGERISDKSIVLSCRIERDFQYNTEIPIFHHWITGDEKFGLTFQSVADARAFYKGVHTAVEDTLEGVDLAHETWEDDPADDDVFMTLDLPVDSSTMPNATLATSASATELLQNSAGPSHEFSS